MEIGDTSKEAVNINETTTESVEETEPAENAKKKRETAEYNNGFWDFYFHFCSGESVA